jgi:hypothetical protein
MRISYYYVTCTSSPLIRKTFQDLEVLLFSINFLQIIKVLAYQNYRQSNHSLLFTIIDIQPALYHEVINCMEMIIMHAGEPYNNSMQ